MTKYLREVLLPSMGMYRQLIFLLLCLPGFQALAVPCPVFTVSGGGTISTGQSATVTLTGAAVIGSTGFDLYRDGVLVTGISASTSNGNVVWTVSQAGTYTVKSSDPCNVTMTGQAVVTINTGPPPTPPTITRVVNGTGCSKAPLETPVLLQAIGSNGTYSWYDLAGNLKATTTTTTGTASWTPEILMDASYRVTVTNANGTSAPQTVTASLYTPPATIISASGPTTICSGETVTLTASAGVSYRWSTGATTQAITVSASGSYSVTVTQNYGCQAKLSTVVVTVNPMPTASITQSGSFVAFGQGSEQNLSATTCSGCSYQWSFSTDGSTWVDEATTPVIPVSRTGYYRVAVTSNGCTKVSAPSGKLTVNNYNYILTNSIQKAGVKTPAQLNALTAGSIQQSIVYFDGLGRAMQSVITQGSPSGKDVVQPIQYDGLGREAFQYLPYTDGTSGLFKTDAIAKTSPVVDPTAYQATKQYQFYQSATGPAGIAYDTKPFAQSVYEASPLNQVREQGAPGLAWQPGSPTAKTIKLLSRSNVANEVRTFSYTFGSNGEYGTVSSATFYDAGQLYVSETTDMHGYKTLEFKDKQGQVVLKKVQFKGIKNSTSTLPDADCMLTYYIYDSFERLRMVIQPEGSELIPTTGVFTPTADAAFLSNWCFTYHYDTRGRVAEKKVPGAGIVFMVYNNRDQLIMTQDAKQRPLKEWNVTKYDSLGRVAMTGRYTHADLVTQSFMQDKASAQAVCYENPYKSTNPELQGYTVNKSFPILLVPGTDKLYTVNHYNEYDTDRDGTKNYNYEGGSAFDRNIGRLTVSKVARTDKTGWLATAYFYDQYGRVIQTQADNHLGGRQLTNTIYDDFTERVKSTTLVHTVNLIGASTLTVKKDFEYDKYGRLLKVLQQNNTDTKVTLSAIDYNELGQVKSKVVGDALQTMDYRYNIRGWLNAINPTALQTPTEERLFGLALLYDKDLQGTNLSASQQQFNGNIAVQQWKSLVGKDIASNTPITRTYTYTYDAANRLTKADYSQATTGLGENFTMGSVTYTKNGNIKSLQQSGLLSYTSTSTQLKANFGVIDNLSYGYSGNRLTKVEEVDTDTDPVKVSSNVSATGLAGDFQDKVNQTTEYTYDDNTYGGNGNLIADANKGIASISYNYLNLPTQIWMNSTGTNKLVFLYDAAGTKLRKEVYEGGTKTSWTDYAGGFVYQKDMLQFFGTEEGRVLNSYFLPNQADPNAYYLYEYHYKDHLGNLRLSFRKQRGDVKYTATMEAINAVNEEANFANLASTRVTDGNAQGELSISSVNLNGTRKSLGPWKTIKVKKGDKISAEVFALYKGNATSTGVNWNVYLTNSANIQGGAESGKNIPLLQAGLSLSPPTNQGTTTIPKAYLKMNFFKEDQSIVKTENGIEYSPIALVKATSLNAWQPYTITERTAPYDGYVQIFLANESNTDVWFDNLTITYKEPKVVQENAYSPWGNNLVGIETQGQPNHEFQYNGKEKQEELGLNWIDYGARNYDAQLGRWHSVDPMASKYYSMTSYAYVGNDPTNIIDPNGTDWTIDKQEKDGRTSYIITLNAKIYNNSGQKLDMIALALEISNQVQSVYSTENIDGDIDVSTTANIGIANSLDEVEDTDHLITIESNSNYAGYENVLGGKNTDGYSDAGGLLTVIPIKTAQNVIKKGKGKDITTMPHEFGHTGGLYHPQNKNQGINDSDKFDHDNLMYDHPIGTQLKASQIEALYQYYKADRLNHPTQFKTSTSIKYAPAQFPYLMIQQNRAGIDYNMRRWVDWRDQIFGF